MDTIKFLSRRPMDTLKVWLMDKKQIHSTWPSTLIMTVIGVLVIFSLALFLPDSVAVKPALVMLSIVLFFIARWREMQVDEAVKKTTENPGLIYKAIALKAKAILENKIGTEVTLGTYLTFVETIFDLPVNHRLALLKENDVTRVLYNLKEMIKNNGGTVCTETMFNPPSYDAGNFFPTVTSEVEIDYSGRLLALLATMQEKKITESSLENILMHTIEDVLNK
jgi:hypothetical protein